jgi:hypothetical protein
MSVIGLQILEPANGRTYRGAEAASVRLRGTVTAPPSPPATLIFKWYSSLEARGTPGSPLPAPAGNAALDFVVPAPPLGVGTHTICLAANEAGPGGSDPFPNVTHAGMAGGPVTPSNPNACVIHVLTATMIAPAPTGPVPNLSRANSTLTAVAPSHWWRPILTNNPIDPTKIERDPDYQAVNQIRYLWRFVPFGAPAGRATATLTPTVAQLTFPTSPFASHVVYQGPLPAGLGTGAYDLTLRVELIANAAIGHEVTRRVNLT